MKMVNRKEQRTRRHRRLRFNLAGTAERPRMSVMISNKHIHLQVVDDEKNVTLLSVSTSGKGAPVKGKNVAVAKAIGALAATRAKAKGIQAVVFDRGGFKFHGRIKAIAEAVREGGVKC